MIIKKLNRSTEIQPVIERLHDVGEHGAVLAPAGANRHVVPRLEQVCLADGVVNLGLESEVEAFLEKKK